MKTAVIIILIVCLAYKYFSFALSRSMRSKPLPENVADIYDRMEYKRWTEYSDEKSFISLFSNTADTLVMLVLFGLDIFPLYASVLPDNKYLSSVILFSTYMLLSWLISFPFSYIEQMKTEQKFGFNKYTVKSFIIDKVKELIMTLILLNLLLILFITLISLTGNFFPISASAAMILITVALSALGKLMMTVFNKFEPLPEGTLKEKLCTLASSYGFELKKISVMKASDKTTKANAFCTGLGRFKEIAIYDNLLEKFPEDEIVGIFAHELAHAKYKDTVLLTALNAVKLALIAIAFGAFSLSSASFADFGFDGINYGFALVALLTLAEPFLFILGIPFAAISRACEKRADAFAAKRGYAESMISAFRRLASENFADLNPHPFIIETEYDHPPISDRIKEMNKYINK